MLVTLDVDVRQILTTGVCYDSTPPRSTTAARAYEKIITEARRETAFEAPVGVTNHRDFDLLMPIGIADPVSDSGKADVLRQSTFVKRFNSG
jgi:hypothetical protein